ncbi:hypothetical protein AB0D38_36075 [Streptomyces sp. NPDC048279]|uniref:hypothetical protein n=1 Tax=Streptomyces sp. NPDC048279 TaxID=3154714 RepID=UPI00344313CD
MVSDGSYEANPERLQSVVRQMQEIKEQIRNIRQNFPEWTSQYDGWPGSDDGTDEVAQNFTPVWQKTVKSCNDMIETFQDIIVAVIDANIMQIEQVKKPVGQSLADIDALGSFNDQVGGDNGGRKG